MVPGGRTEGGAEGYCAMGGGLGSPGRCKTPRAKDRAGLFPTRAESCLRPTCLPHLSWLLPTCPPRPWLGPHLRCGPRSVSR